MKYLIVVVIFLVAVILSVESRGRIFNGTDADTSKFKYQVKVRVPKSASVTNEGYLCGGSLINNYWCMTAAHCFDNGYIKLTKVYLGYGPDNAAGKVRDASNIIIHEDYSKTTYVHDIALIQISYVPYDDFIQNVILSRKTSLDIFNVTVAGWGQTGKAIRTGALQQTTLRVMDNNFCRSKIGSKYGAGQFCTFEQATKTCVGDSGGPAVIKGTIEQVGIVSYGITPNCTGNFPTCFTRVPFYLPWIERVTGLSF